MYKGKAVLTIEIEMNIPEETTGLLPLDEIQDNLVHLDQVIQELLDEEILCPEDGITGRAILEEAYIDCDDESEVANDGR